jgi:hypothetical protein
MIDEVNGQYVISSHGVWLPGCFESRYAANLAFRLPDTTLQALQDSVNDRPETADRVITLAMVRAAVQAAKERTR